LLSFPTGTQELAVHDECGACTPNTSATTFDFPGTDHVRCGGSGRN
jgi:hypothetical protein